MPTVFVVDDDEEVLRGLERLLEAEGLDAATFQSPRAFLDSIDPSARGCLVLDLAMPEASGLDLQRALAEKGILLPVIFLTGRGDIRASVQAMKFGAVDFLTKPVEDEELLAAVRNAFEKDRAARRQLAERTDIGARFAKLTPRERDVVMLVVAGRMNKQIAAELGVAEKTVKFHRHKIMQKVGVRSVAELARLAERIGLKRQQP